MGRGVRRRPKLDKASIAHISKVTVSQDFIVNVRKKTGAYHEAFLSFDCHIQIPKFVSAFLKNPSRKALKNLSFLLLCIRLLETRLLTIKNVLKALSF